MMCAELMCARSVSIRQHTSTYVSMRQHTCLPALCAELMCARSMPQQQQRQYLHFCTSSSVSICTFVPEEWWGADVCEEHAASHDAARDALTRVEQAPLAAAVEPVAGAGVGEAACATCFSSFPTSARGSCSDSSQLPCSADTPPPSERDPPPRALRARARAGERLRIRKRVGLCIRKRMG